MDAWLAPFRPSGSGPLTADALERHPLRPDGSANTDEKEKRSREKEKQNDEIKVTSIFVDDQDKALLFYTEVLGFAKKTDFSPGPYRWLTVASPEEPGGTELQLALNSNPAAKTYQQAIFQQSQPAIMFFTDVIKADYERIKAGGAEFTMPPTEVTGSTIAMLETTLAATSSPDHPTGALLMLRRRR